MRRAARLAFALSAALAACGGSGSEPSCPNDALVCPQPAPSYSATVAGIIRDRCLSCHSPGGQQASLPFTTYDQVFASRSPMLNQVYACKMPLAGSTPLTAQERTALIGWLVCGAPQN